MKTLLRRKAPSLEIPRIKSDIEGALNRGRFSVGCPEYRHAELCAGPRSNDRLGEWLKLHPWSESEVVRRTILPRVILGAGVPTRRPGTDVDEFVTTKAVFTVGAGDVVFQEKGSVVVGRDGKVAEW